MRERRSSWLTMRSIGTGGDQLAYAHEGDRGGRNKMEGSVGRLHRMTGVRGGSGKMGEKAR